MMLKTSTQFAQFASVITHKVSELLYAPVFVVDEHGSVITSSDPQREGLTFAWGKSEKSAPGFLRIPLSHNTEIGEVIVGKPHNAEVISPRLAQALVELVINQTSVQNRPSRHHLKNRLIYELLHGQMTNEAVVLSQAKQLGIDLTPPRAVILIDAANYILRHEHPSQKDLRKLSQLGKLNEPNELSELSDLDLRCHLQTVINSIVSFFHLPSDTICADLGEGQIGVLKASDTKNLGLWADQKDAFEGAASSWANLAALKRAADALLQRLRSDTGAVINIGIGRYHPGLRGLARSYEDARAALSLGSRFQGTNRVHCLAELGIAAFVGVADEQTKIDLAKYLLSPLDHEPDLLSTLGVFFDENCCPSATAKRLSIHRNTLSYRLDKIASLTGLEPRRFDNAVQMRLCLLLRSLRDTRM